MSGPSAVKPLTDVFSELTGEVVGLDVLRPCVFIGVPVQSRRVFVRCDEIVAASRSGKMIVFS